MPLDASPLIAVNYKVYAQSTGANAVPITRALEKAAADAEATVAVCPAATDLRAVAGATTLPVLAQHVDPHVPGQGTGHVTAEAAKAAGAVGTLLNHSERPVGLADLAASVARARENGLAVIICADDVPAARAAAALSPDFVAVEPPELIGGDVSVTSADPEVVSGTVEAVQAVNPEVRVLCGAGVKTGDDVAKALELGAEGVLLASGVTKAQDPAAALTDLLSGV